MDKPETVKGYKGFDKDMKCRGFQYEVGKTYDHDGSIEVCSSGFHFCKNPLDVLDYYSLTDSEFAEVEAIGETKSDNNKTVTNKITIGAKLGLPGFIKAAFSFIWEQCKIEPANENSIDTGHSSKLAASGHSSKLAASGDYSKLAASGDYSKLAASGHSSKLAASGDYSKLAINGEYSVGACVGYDSKIKGKTGCWITLAEWEYSEKLNKYIPVCVKSAQIDGEVLKEDTWYEIKNGEFTEAE